MVDPCDIEVAAIRTLLRECRGTTSAPLKLVQHRRLMDALTRLLAIYDEPPPYAMELRRLVRRLFRDGLEFKPKVPGAKWWVRDRETFDNTLDELRRFLRLED